MTLPDQRTRALYEAIRFLESLLDRSATPGVPQEIRLEAMRILRHAPTTIDLDRIARTCEGFEPIGGAPK